ncbi:HdeD family acid-resistance protein [Terrabacter sp. AAH1]
MSSTVPDATSPDPERQSAGVARARGRHRATLEESHWTLPLVALGILSIVLGVLVLAWPGVTLLVVAITFGLELVVAGALRISTSRLLPTEPAWLKPVSLVLGALSVVAGIICLLRPGTSLLVVAIVIAAGWLSEGVAAVAQGVRAGRSATARTFLVASGVVSVLAGLVVAIFPGSSLVLLARLAGVMLVLIGVAELVTAFMARRAGTPGASTPRPAPA